MAEKRFVVMKRTQTLHLLFLSVSCSIAFGSPEFHLIKKMKTFNEAKTYCREMYTDLASVQNLTDLNNLNTLFLTKSTRTWIGLESDGVRKWHWSRPYQKLDFLNWREGEPQNTDKDVCAVMDPIGKWFESDCGTRRAFVCQGNTDSGGHTFVAETKSWRKAQDYCRSLSSELVSINSQEENEAVRIISKSQNVWIGLFKDPWKWSDGSESSFRFWKPDQPNYLKGQDCVAAVLRNDGKWNDLNCGGKRDFICRGARKVFPATTIKPNTQLSQTTKQVPKNLTSFPNNSQEVTVHFTVISSNQSNATNATIEDAATTVNTPTQNTTEAMLSMLSTKFNNAATEMSNVTAEQLPSNTTVEATASGVSTATTLMVTSAKTSTQMDSTTQLRTPKPTEDSQSQPPGNMILINENLTWTDAMTYCRRHHVDLVHVTSKHIQEKVVEEAKNSTSPHVWLGLRYACNLNFWFWISSSTGCYQNWAPGQGSEGKYDCDTSGAIEATGGQQWVGLSQTEELNFICSTCPG